MFPRLYTSDSLQTGVLVTLLPPQHHYLAHVLRCKEGDGVHVFNGRDGLWHSLYSPMGLRVQECIQPQPLTPRPRRLAYSPVKQHELLLQKAVELGVTHLQPLLCDRTVVRHENPQRLYKIIIEACEQCQRLDVPELLPAMRLKAFVLSMNESSSNTSPPSISSTALPCAAMSPLRSNPGLVVLHPQASEHLGHVAVNPAWILVGPEGGWSKAESAWMAHQSEVRMCHLGERILRAETAAMVAAVWWDWHYLADTQPSSVDAGLQRNL